MSLKKNWEIYQDFLVIVKAVLVSWKIKRHEKWKDMSLFENEKAWVFLKMKKHGSLGTWKGRSFLEDEKTWVFWKMKRQGSFGKWKGGLSYREHKKKRKQKEGIQNHHHPHRWATLYSWAIGLPSLISLYTHPAYTTLVLLTYSFMVTYHGFSWRKSSLPCFFA